MTRFRIATAAGVAMLAGATYFAGADDERNDPPARPKPEQLFNDLDSNGDGRLVADEIAEEQQRFFERLIRIGDKDENGELSKEEFLAAMQDRPPRDREDPPRRGPRDGEGPPRGPRDGQPGFDPARMFDRLDQDKDGSISVEEVPERVKPMIERLLKKNEKDADASLTKDEFVELMKDSRPPFGREGGPRPEGRPGPGGFGPGRFGPGGPGGPPPMPKFIKELDADGDGKLSKEELSTLSEKFAELDGNDDGVLDMAELMGPPPEFAGRPFNRGRGFGPPGGRPGFGPPDGRPGPEGRPGFGPPEGRGPEAGPRRGPNPENFLKRFDKNDDGKLTEDEVNENLKKRFDKIDSNADGAIDVEEIKAMLDKRAAKQDEDQPKKKKKQADANSDTQ